jgi:hypothetical protein
LHAKGGPSGSLAALKAFLDDRYKFSFDKFHTGGAASQMALRSARKSASAAAIPVPVPTPSCYNVSSAAPSGPGGRVVCSDWSGCGGGLDGRAWDYQACSEVLQPLSSNNVTDMFWPREWTLEWQTAHCQARYTAKPLRAGRWLAHSMGLDALRAGEAGGFSRVIFSNGRQDPWNAGGVRERAFAKASQVVVVEMENGAHHVDLRAPDPDDTADVVAARVREKAVINGWLAEIKNEAARRQRLAAAEL